MFSDKKLLLNFTNYHYCISSYFLSNSNVIVTNIPVLTKVRLWPGYQIQAKAIVSNTNRSTIKAAVKSGVKDIQAAAFQSCLKYASVLFQYR